jgi:uncharacterized protein (TIGR02145 family)
MNCTKCKAEWKPPAGKTITNCPFCGEVIFAATLAGKDAALHEMLRSIVLQFGREILGQARLIGLLTDFKPDTERKYLNILRQAVNEGVGSKLLELGENQNSGSILQINVLKENLKNNHGFSSTADYVMDCFLFALGWTNEPPKEEQNLLQGNNLSILEQTIEMALSDNELTADEAEYIFKLSDELKVTEKETSDFICSKLQAKGMIPDVFLSNGKDITRHVLTSRNWKQEIKHSNPQLKTQVRWDKIALKAEKKHEEIGLISGQDYILWVALNDGVTQKGREVKKGEWFALEKDISKSSNKAEKGKSSVSYESVKIGNQVWMKQNLDVSHFRNGDPIPEAKTDEEWEKSGKKGKPAWCYYDNDPEKGKVYGKLYNWYAVNDPRGLAPKGWHVPDEEEWDKLISYLGGMSEAGGKMKTAGITYWKYPNFNASNSSGFSGLPGGFRYTKGNFNNVGSTGYWWSSTEYSSMDAGIRCLDNLITYAIRNYSNKEGGKSVRCVRDSIDKENILPKSEPMKTNESVNIRNQIQKSPPSIQISFGNKTIETVTIGNQIWMKQNLDVSHFRNGDPIPEAKSYVEWARAGIERKPACCYFDNDPDNGKIFGKLYNWYAVNDQRGLAPEGWHVPSIKEWNQLIDFLGERKVDGGKKKNKITTAMENPNNGELKSIGFTGILGGHRDGVGSCYGIGVDGHWWSSTGYSSNYAWSRDQYYFYAIGISYFDDRERGRSVLCIKDNDIRLFSRVVVSNFKIET